MRKNLTLVTALFNIGRGEMDTDMRRSFDHYLECFERFLKLDYPMVIYIQQEYEHVVWKHRSRENTHVVIKSLDDLRKFPFYDNVQKIRNDPKWTAQAGWLSGSTQAKLELYNPLVMSKQFMLNDASLFNNFDSKYYLWVDAGLSNTVNLEQYFTTDFEQRIIPHLNKMMFVAFPYDGQAEVHGFPKHAMNNYAGKDTQYVCRGGVFGGSKDAINSFNEKYYHLLNETLNAGYMGTEESVFTLLTYRDPQKYNLRFIEGNGLVYKFFEDLKSGEITKPDSEFPLAFYTVTYNLPKQFTMWAESFKKAYPVEFAKHKKYVVNNSTDSKVKKEYDKLFKTYDFEVIHEGENVGINDGRVLCSKHFDKSNHDYMVFFEDDMLLVCDGDNDADYGESPNGKIFKGQPCKNGFIRYIPDLFQKCIDILEDNELDFLRLNHTEVFGDCHFNWGYKNVAAHRRDEIFPDDKGSDELRWKTKIYYTGAYKGVSYAVGEFHYSNWPLLFNKRGNHQLFLSDPYEHVWEQTLSSLSCQYVFDKKMKVGSLLASPINHFRKYHYAANTRRENKHDKK